MRIACNGHSARAAKVACIVVAVAITVVVVAVVGCVLFISTFQPHSHFIVNAIAANEKQFFHLHR